MAIKITQPLGFDSRLPNFARDVINSLDYSNNNPMYMTQAEKNAAAEKYDVGHIVYDTYTKLHYIWLGVTDGWGLPSVSMTKVRFSDVNAASETLYLDNEEHDFADGFGNRVYVPINSEPADWSENWSGYYVFDSTSKTYVRNQDETYNQGMTYYVAMLRGI